MTSNESVKFHTSENRYYSFTVRRSLKRIIQIVTKLSKYLHIHRIFTVYSKKYKNSIHCTYFYLFFVFRGKKVTVKPLVFHSLKVRGFSKFSAPSHDSMRFNLIKLKFVTSKLYFVATKIFSLT